MIANQSIGDCVWTSIAGTGGNARRDTGQSSGWRRPGHPDNPIGM